MNDEQKLKTAELNHLRAIEHFKSVISMAELALKSSILINGGASIALLTFIGNVKTIIRDMHRNSILWQNILLIFRVKVRIH
jgi:hypothetical protein